jgi:hypothetical protein
MAYFIFVFRKVRGNVKRHSKKKAILQRYVDFYDIHGPKAWKYGKLSLKSSTLNSGQKLGPTLSESCMHACHCTVAEPASRLSGVILYYIGVILYYIGVIKLRNKLKCISLMVMSKIHWCPVTP